MEQLIINREEKFLNETNAWIEQLDERLASASPKDRLALREYISELF